MHRHSDHLSAELAARWIARYGPVTMQPLLRPRLLGEPLPALTVACGAGVALTTTMLRLAYPAAALLAGSSRGSLAAALLTATFGIGLARRWLGQRATAQVRALLFRRLTQALRSAPVNGALATSPAEIQSRVTRGIPWVEAYVTTTVPLLFGQLLALPVILAAAATQLGWHLAALAFASIALAAGMGVYAGRRASRAAERAWEEYQPIANLLDEAIRGGAELRVHRLEDRVEQRMSALVARWSSSERAAQLAGVGTSFGVPAIAVMLALLFGAALGLQPVRYAESVVGSPNRETVLASVILLSGLPTLWSIARGAADVALERRYLAALQKFVASCTAIASARSIDVLTGTIALRHVTYNYAPTVAAASARSAVVLGNLVWIEGEALALLGSNGSGKSTLGLLLLGLLEPSSGEIVLLGPDDEPAAYARPARAAYLPQTPFWEPGATVAESIRFAAPTATDAEIEALLGELWNEANSQHVRQVLSRTIDTLSAGERRLIAIARTLLRTADLVVLDEPEAGLDRAARKRVAAALQKHRGKRRVLLLTHDDDIMALADRTIDLDRQRREDDTVRKSDVVR